MEEAIVQWTNKRINQVLDTMDVEIRRNSKYSYLKTTDVMEMRAYYGVTYARGLQHDNMTDYRKLWSESSYGHSVYNVCLSRTDTPSSGTILHLMTLILDKSDGTQIGLLQFVIFL